MYASYFGLKETPFTITPNPRYLYLSARHAEALAHLVYGVTESGGFIQLTGEVGTGKTTLVRCLLEQLPDHVDVALILNPQMALREFLRAVCRELGVATTAGESEAALTQALNAHLLAAHARGRRIVLIIDEAQGLATDVLEQVRLLTNLETVSQKLMQIILVGQPELRDVLARRDLRQLAQRITARYHLTPLNVTETRAYIEHRLNVAGAGGSIFTPAAHKALYRLSGGIPRLVNILADRALLGAYAAEQRTVGRWLARRAAHEVLEPRRAHRPWGRLAAVTVLLALAVALAGFLMRGNRFGIQAATFSARGAVKRFDPLAHWLNTTGHPSDTDSAFATLFGLWGARYTVGSGVPACTQAEQSGLRCLYRRASWQDLLAFDRPAIVTLSTPDGNNYQAVVRGWVHDRVTLQAGNATHAFPLAALRRDWNGDFLLLWQPPPHSDGDLKAGMSGPAVTWLDNQLAQLDGRAISADAGKAAYDAALAAAVMEFQRRHGLKVDGIAGEQTLIELTTALNRAGVPRLAVPTAELN